MRYARAAAVDMSVARVLQAQAHPSGYASTAHEGQLKSVEKVRVASGGTRAKWVLHSSAREHTQYGDASG